MNINKLETGMVKRKVFLENLPKWEDGHQKGRINWCACLEQTINFIYNDIKGVIKIVDYNNKKQMLKIIYNDKTFDMKIGQLRECKLGGILGVRTNDFKVEIGTRFKDEKRDIIITDREYRENTNNKGKFLKWYKYTCNVCGWTEGWIEESNLNKEQGCSCCYGQTPVLGVNTIYDTDKWMIPIVGEEFAKTHTHSCSDKIYPTCPDCGRVKDKKMIISTIYEKHSMCCQCSDNIPYTEKNNVFNS